jgi:hypothetical protein
MLNQAGIKEEAEMEDDLMGPDFLVEKMKFQTADERIGIIDFIRFCSIMGLEKKP